MLCHLFGLTSTNPFTAYRSVQLAHASAAHSLLITTFPDEGGYKSSLTGWKTSDGRSLTGSIRVAGGSYKPPEQWQINAIVSEQQLDLFRELLARQNSSNTPISLIDRVEEVIYIAGAMNLPTWLAGYPVTNTLGQPKGFTAWNVWVDVDEEFKTQVAPDRYLLQFKAEQQI